MSGVALHELGAGPPMALAFVLRARSNRATILDIFFRFGLDIDCTYISPPSAVCITCRST